MRSREYMILAGRTDTLNYQNIMSRNGDVRNAG